MPLFAPTLLSLAGCQPQGEERPVVVDVIGEEKALADPLRHDDMDIAQVVLGAKDQGLVAFDAQGEVVAALAESWIVSDGGQSYIFRLRRIKWANGAPVTAEAVARLLAERMRANPNLLAGLKPEVRAMTERVIEIRLQTALPTFLQLLAQPRLAIVGKEGGTGPYMGSLKLKRLYLRPMMMDADAEDADAPPEIKPSDQRTLETGRAALAMARFQYGDTDLVLGGRFQDLLLIPNARLGATDVHADPVPGLFGLAIVGKSRFLANRDIRDALSRAIDRAALAKALNLQGWTTTTAPLPAQLDLDHPPSSPPWTAAPIGERLAAASATVASWRAAHGAPPLLRIALPAGAGATLLFRQLAADYGRLGLRIDRVAMNEQADLRLIDAVAGFDSALWYLSRIDCSAGLSCDPDASTYLNAAREADSLLEQATMLGKAERLIVAHTGYIPLGLPIRWSLVSRRLTGFSPSPRGIHPLDRLIAQPN